MLVFTKHVVKEKGEGDYACELNIKLIQCNIIEYIII